MGSMDLILKLEKLIDSRPGYSAAQLERDAGMSTNRITKIKAAKHPVENLGARGLPSVSIPRRTLSTATTSPRRRSTPPTR